jgi:hypothetical protein
MNRFVALLMSSTIVFTATKALALINHFGTAYAIETSTQPSLRGYSGKLVLQYTNSTQQVTSYWGGTTCSNFPTLSGTQIEILTQAVIVNKAITMTSEQQGQNFCLVGFTIRN